MQWVKEKKNHSKRLLFQLVVIQLVHTVDKLLMLKFVEMMNYMVVPNLEFVLMLVNLPY